MSIGYNNMALPGLSGYDFSSVVDMMVQNYSLPINKMQDRHSNLEVKKNAWRDINTRLSALDNAMDKLRDKSTWSATSAASSNSDVLEVSSSAGSVKGSYSVSVSNLAVAQTVASADAVNVDDSSSPTAFDAGTFSIKVGEKVTDIDVAAGASLDGIAEAINNADAGVSASVVKVTGGYKLAIMSNETGTGKAATFADVGTGTVLQDLGILTGAGTLDSSDNLNITQAAEDASLIVNGIDQIISPSNTVTTAIPGMTFDLKGESVNPVTVTVSADYSTAEKAVKSFVDQYNSVMSFIEDKTSYNQDTKAKGDMFGDPVLQGIQSRLRNMIGGFINNPTGPFKTLAEVGISTSSAGFGKSAVLEFNTSEFRDALEENADSVANLFGAPSGGVTPIKESTETENAEGLANLLSEYLHPMVMYDGTLDQTQKSYQRQIDQVKKEIEDFADRIEAYAERTRLKFAALETQLAGLASQSQWLSSQISAMGAFNKEND